ncbi:MAG: hypothetical protein MUO61_05270 [Dehalococcoidia bacterium]|nr:hypothetical protein [Dehalococcoidia bacterium]
MDDPSTNPIIDTYDCQSGPSGPDNYGTGASLSSSDAVTNGSGEARVTLTVSLNPGDNFKIAASINETKLTTMKQEMADGLEPLPASVFMSEMLTVWRHLWVERDSMDAVASSGPEKDYVSGIALLPYMVESSPLRTTVNLNQPLPVEFQESDHFVPGVYKACNRATVTVITNTGYYNPAMSDYVTVFADLTGADPSYDLYDDDYNPATLQPKAQIPYWPTLSDGGGDYASQYRRAYIEPVYPSEYSNVVPFDRNLSASEVEYGVGTWNDYRDLSSSADFWNVLVVAGFQCGDSEDGDPITEGVCEGKTRLIPNECVLYLEAIRDFNNDWVPIFVSQIMAHEIGHSGGLGTLFHCTQPNCIMRVGADGSIFCDYCIAKLRNIQGNW